jgi:hypothetical protein
MSIYSERDLFRHRRDPYLHGVHPKREKNSASSSSAEAYFSHRAIEPGRVGVDLAATRAFVPAARETPAGITGSLR